MATISEHYDCLRESLCDLKQDTKLLQIALRGTAHEVEPLTLECLLRLTDYLQQHVNDVCFLCERLLQKTSDS